MSATWEDPYCAQARIDTLSLWSALVQSHEFNRAARTRLEQIKDETVLALWDADKALNARLLGQPANAIGAEATAALIM